MKEQNSKLRIFDELATFIGERKSISKRQLENLISKNGWDFEPGELEDFLAAHDILLLNNLSKKNSKSSSTSNIWLYSQELSNIKILSKEEELETAFAMRKAVKGMLSIIPLTTVSLQHFVSMGHDPDFFGLFRLSTEVASKKQSHQDAMEIIDEIKRLLDKYRDDLLPVKEEYYDEFLELINELTPFFKVFDHLQTVFEKIDTRINENSGMMRTIENLTGMSAKMLLESDNTLNSSLEEIKIAEVFNVRDILRHEARRTYRRWSRRRTRIKNISLIDVKDIPKKIEEFEDYLDEYQKNKRRLIESTVRLVMNIAKNYSGFGVDYLDLVQEGNHALINAVERFDPDRGYRLATYTIWWIRQSMMQLIARQSRSIRIPTYVISWVRRFGTARRNLREKLGRMPTDREIALELDLPEEKVREFTQAMMGEVSLDTPISKSDDRTLEDVLEDDKSESPVMIVNLSMIKRELKKMLSVLTPKEAKIITLRYGLEDNFPRTLNEIGEMFGLSRERIRQIETKSLKKLRSQQNVESLGVFFNSDN